MRTHVLNSRHQRQLSIAMQEFDEWQYVLESLKRKFKRFRSGMSKKREMELLWENAQKQKKEGKAFQNINDTQKTVDESMMRAFSCTELDMMAS